MEDQQNELKRPWYMQLAKPGFQFVMAAAWFLIGCLGLVRLVFWPSDDPSMRFVTIALLIGPLILSLFYVIAGLLARRDRRANAEPSKASGPVDHVSRG